MKVLKSIDISVNVTAEGGGGTGFSRYSVSEAVAAGLNHARWLMRPECLVDAAARGKPRTRCEVRVEVLCGICHGDGKVPGGLRHGPKKCPSCAGGTITSPISGPTALVFTVMAGGAMFDGSAPPSGADCKCDESTREGKPGEVCDRCAKGIWFEAARAKAAPYVQPDAVPASPAYVSPRLDTPSGDEESACLRDGEFL